MVKLIQTALLTSAVHTAASNSFGDLTYGTSQESASAIIDALLNGKETATTSTGATTTPETTSTVASLILDETVVDFIVDGFQDSHSTESTNVCAPSLAEAQSKICSGEPITTCRDAMDCSHGEACFLDVMCEPKQSSSSSSTTTTTTTSSTSSEDAFEISHFVMLGTDVEGDTMTLAYNDLQTTVAPEPQLEPSMSQFSSATTSISSHIESTLETIQEKIDNELFLYETPLSEWIPSTVYRFSGFYDGLKVMHSVGVAGKKIYLGANSPEEDFLGNAILEDETNCPHCFMYGLVNVAAFLAQAMKETIRYDACDENSWDRVGSMEMYPISNSCGQLGQSYQDYHCSEEEKHMECPVDPDMQITAVTHAKWWGAPGPLMCGPKSVIPQTGYWDYAYECNNPWGNPPESCDVYEDQKAGKAINDEPYPNAAGRTDVEGCCWWGRGVIQTSGVCNFGKLNYHLGKRAFEEGRESRYPDIDFCKDPEIICTSDEHKELKWIAGFFYWVDQVQPYDQGGWNYLAELKKFVNEGMTGDAFINSVSGIVNRGCHNPPCGTGDLDGGPERAENFFRILDALDFSFVDVSATTTTTTTTTTPPPTPMPIVGTASPVASTITYNCGGGEQQLVNSLSGAPPPSVDLVFDYELHSDLDVAVSQALQEIKDAILSDIAERLGCTEATERRLQGSSGNVVGLMASRSDMPDPDAAGCLVEVDSLEPTACTPVKGEIKVFSEVGSSEADLQNMSKYLKDTIKESMDSGKYESSVVRRVTYIGDRDLYLDGLDPQVPVGILTEPEESGLDWMKIAMYSLAGVCAFLLCLLCMIIPSTRRKSPTHDEELAMLEYMNAHRESHYKGRSLTEPQSPHNAIQRRSEHLRAVQQGRTLQAPYALESGTATSESDDDEDSYFRRRHAVNRNSRGRNHASPRDIVVMQEAPLQKRESARQIAAEPSIPPMIIGETGHFYVKGAPNGEIETEHDQQEEREDTLQAIGYQPQRGGGVDSLPGNESSSEEEELPVRSSRRRHTTRGTIQETHDPQFNAERRQRKNRETWAAPRSDANEMSKEERQRRIERARSNRKSLG